MGAIADESLAAMRARNKFGMAIAAIIRMIATTIKSSISENPFCFGIIKLSPSTLNRQDFCVEQPHTTLQSDDPSYLGSRGLFSASETGGESTGEYQMWMPRHFVSLVNDR